MRQASIVDCSNNANINNHDLDKKGGNHEEIHSGI